MTNKLEALDIVVVGAGFAGLYAIHKFRELGMSVHCLEAAPDVGGVWFHNRYPGARCDVESLQYSYSFSQEIEADWQWSERYAAQPEILAYINFVADRLDLRRDISFMARVASSIWNADEQIWHITTEAGANLQARFVILASGGLSVTRKPDFPGVDSFEGLSFHTGQWPEEPVDFQGKRVAVIGTGSSGIQAVTAIAPQVAELVVFQRTPNFIIPSRNRPLDDAARQHWAENSTAFRARAKQVGTLYEFPSVGALDVDDAARRAEYQRRWDGGGVNFVHSFNNIYTDQAANDTAAEFVRERIREIVNDPVTAAKLCPTDHPLGSKRICVASGYYEAFNLPHVKLVDLREDSLEAITPAGVRTATVEHEVDMIVFATGYDALTGALTAIDIRGVDGKKLSDKWSAGPINYLGLMTEGFPNMFIVTGPGSPSVLVNMLVGIEQHIDWIADCIATLRERGAASIEPDVSAERDWVTQVNAEADKTLFVKANSWYLGANVPGKPRVFLPYAGGIGRYRGICDRVAADGYEGFRITPEHAPGESD